MDRRGGPSLPSAPYFPLHTHIFYSLALAIAITVLLNAVGQHNGTLYHAESIKIPNLQHYCHAGASLFRPSQDWLTISFAAETILTLAIIEVTRTLLSKALAAARKVSKIGTIGSRGRRSLTGGMLGQGGSNFGTTASASLRENLLQTDSYSNADPHDTDPGLLKKHSTFRSYTTSVATYPSIRTFYRPHPQADKLPSEPTPLPLLVFVHGLGGCLAQFKPILTSLVDVAPCLGIDLPGCGRSAFSPTSWSAYAPHALAELIRVVIEKHTAPDQEVILIGHSLGCSLSALVSSVSTKHGNATAGILGLVGICPAAEPPKGRKVKIIKALLYIPSPIFDLWRIWDRRGGPYSASVARFVGQDADIEVKKLQEKFNTQSRTPVYRRIAWGLLQRTGNHGGMPGLDIWAKLKIPIALVGGDADAVTKVDQIAKIARALGRAEKPRPQERSTDVLLEKSVEAEGEKLNRDANSGEETTCTSNAKSDTETTMLGTKQSSDALPLNEFPQYTLRRQVLKTSILPSPASHALLYDSATSRILSGLIQTFLYEHIDTRLSLGWQLQHLSTEGKWDVKNLAKWQAVNPVSEPIVGIFRAMKTLREVDETHSPESFAKKWRGSIKAVIDISHESPVYDPRGLDDRGIEYHKFPTVSKIPPSAEETHDFALLVDQLRSQPTPSTSTDNKPLIGVHCHYGFNRTGFFICSYLIEKESYGVQQAIDTFGTARPPGIRHAHFLDELWVRYCVGLKRAPTM
ncbi:MAG: hypothetical protein Q9164_004618 [Protoblastenia rupestris]